MKNMARVVGLSIVFVRNLLCLIGAQDTVRKVSHVIVLIMPMCPIERSLFPMATSIEKSKSNDAIVTGHCAPNFVVCRSL